MARELVADDAPTGIHDVADGGLGLALAELAVAAGVGVTVEAGLGLDDHIGLFAESSDRIVVAVSSARVAELVDRRNRAGLGATVLGTAGGDRITLGTAVDVGLDAAVAAWRNRLPAAFDAGATH